MSREKKRTTFQPAFYRVRFYTVRGLTWTDCRTLGQARKVARRERGSILACWYVEGARHIDSEPVGE